MLDLRPLFPAERVALLDVLGALDDAGWEAPTPCPGWSVRDLCCHVLGEDLGLLARERDGHLGGWLDATGADLAAALAAANQAWIDATRRLSPRQVVEQLRASGEELAAWLAGVDLTVSAGVSWAGPGPVPKWLDVARHFTERWVHQQQVRIAVGRPELDDARYVGPVLRTFAWSLPVAYGGVDAAPGTTVAVEVTGPGGGVWAVTRDVEAWSLAEGPAARPDATVRMSVATAWRLYTAALDDTGAVERSGPDPLTRPVLAARAIIV